MPDFTWNSLETAFLTGTVEELRATPVSASAAVVVVDCIEPHAALLALTPRMNVPIIVLSDADFSGAAYIVAAGADDVLARGASFTEIMRAARHAVARNRRGLGGPPTFAGGARSAHGDSSEASGAGSDQAGISTRSRDHGPKDMPAQLQAVGRLAGGVGHDFNNLLQVIGGSAEELVHELEPGDPRRDAAQTIVDATRRAATLTHKLLAFGRRQTLIATSIDVSALISESLTHLRGRVGPRVRISTKLAQGLPHVHADRSQILEVLSNLADNAAEAMPDGGALSIVTSAIDVDDQLRRDRPWLRQGHYVRVDVADTGAGIDEQALPHLFEPFFSTKTQWGGTGMGLSSVYGIIKQTGGFIWVESQIDHGTRITILLPPVAEPAQASASTEVRGRVVLVEDDDGVRELLVGVLTHYGYTVAAYGSGEDALEHEGRFDLLLSDVLLPGVNGPDLAREMRKKHPGVPVLLMSGDTGHVVDPKELDARGFLQKPFSARTLVTRVEELMAGTKGKKRPPSGR